MVEKTIKRCAYNKYFRIHSIDGKNAIMLYKNPILHDHTKYIIIKHHFIKEKVQKVEVQMYQISF
jgi:hypothetical protein